VKRLVELTVRPDLSVDEEVAAEILRLGRSDLRRYLSSLRRAIARSSVHVDLEGQDEETVRRTLQDQYPERNVDVTPATGTGGGLRLAVGDDVLDASVVGRVQAVIRELGRM
jgi:hypothetical protein